MIISGHRRWLVLKEINKELKIRDEEECKAICVVKHFESELDEKEAIIEANRQREKTPLQIYREVKLLKHIYSERARLRQLAPLQPKFVALDSAQREEMKNESGRTGDILAKKTGVKRDKLQKIMHIGEAYDTGDKDVIAAVNRLNSGESTVDATFKKLEIINIARSNKPEAEYAQSLIFEMNKNGDDALTPNQADKRLKHYVKKANIPKPTASKPPEGTYNVIVANPPSIDAAMSIHITDAKNAACFLWARTDNLSKTMELMRAWGFDLKSIAVWDRNNLTSESWFSGKVEFLLLGIKGDLKPTAHPPIIFKALKNTGSGGQPFGKNEWPEDYVYDMAEQMFTDQHYMDPFRANGRERWGQPTIIESICEAGDNATKESGV